jgi:probable rRNA maturation factor
MPAAIEDRQRRVTVSAARLGRAADRALAAVGRPAGLVEIAVVSDEEIRRLNARYRAVRRRTDVLAFPLEEPDAALPLVGQIVISADAARRQARGAGVSVALELDLLVTHGTLHLIGYDDRDPVEADLMHRREREILGDSPDRLWRGLLHAHPTEGRRPVDGRNARRQPSRSAQPRQDRTSAASLQQHHRRARSQPLDSGHAR